MKTVLMNRSAKSNELADMTQKRPREIRDLYQNEQNEFPLQKKMQPNISGEIQLKTDTKILNLVEKSG